MGLRNYITLKYLSLLLFIFGLVTPVVANDEAAAPNQSGAQSSVAGVEHYLFAQLLFEEPSGEEEREAKDYKAQPAISPCTFISCCFWSHDFTGQASGFKACPINKLRAHSSLFRLHRTLII